MFNELYELYKIYQIYKKLDKFRSQPDELNDESLEEQCQEIKNMIFAGGFIYIKFAQWVISRLRSETNKRIKYLVTFFDDIFDNCPYHTLEETEKIFKNEFEKNIESIVNMDTIQPIASGSVGQVYKAELLKPVYKCNRCQDIIYESHTGLCPVCFSDLDSIDNVAIKIKHPDIDNEVKRKSKLFNLIMFVQKFKWIKNWLSLHVEVKDFIANLTAQTNFNIEADNNRRFQYNFQGNPLIYFPVIIKSSQSALITEYVDGISLDDIHDYKQLKCCLNYGCMVYQMVLINNFCHGDLHHKNWKIREISGTNTPADGDYQLIIYDYGICFSSQDINFNRQLIKAFKTFDTTILLDNLKSLIAGDYDENVIEFARDIIMKYKDDSIDMVHLLNRLNDMLIKYNCWLTTDSLNIIILLSLIDSTLRKQNILGGHNVVGISGDLLPSSNVRAKDLDIIAYAKSRNAYPELVAFLEGEHRIRRENSNVVLFGAVQCNGMEFDPPE